MRQLPVTAIVVTYRTGPRLRECLYALLACPDVSATLIVDNGNPPADTEWLKSFAASHSRMQLISPGENLGFGRAVNLASRKAPEGILLLVNPDAVIKHDAVDALRAASSGLKSPWIVGGRIFGVDGQEARGARRRPLSLARAMLSMMGVDIWNLHKVPLPDGPVPVGAVSGAFLMIGSQGFRHLGGFDETFFLHVEDVDLCRRAQEAGGEVVFCPAAGALHYGSTSDVRSKLVARHKADSLAYYFEKHARDPVSRLAIRYIVAPALKWLLPLRARG